MSYNNFLISTFTTNTIGERERERERVPTRRKTVTLSYVIDSCLNYILELIV